LLSLLISNNVSEIIVETDTIEEIKIIILKALKEMGHLKN